MKNPQKTIWVKWLGFGVMLWAGILVAQENLDTTTETTTESATESAAPIDVPESAPAEKVEAHESEAVEPTDEELAATSDEATSGFDLDRYEALMAGIAVFVVSVFVGFEVITKVPQTLHTPLMSVTNAISSVIIVGAIIAGLAGDTQSIFNTSSIFGFIAISLAAINIFGGFLVTQRMLAMYKKKKKDK